MRLAILVGDAYLSGLAVTVALVVYPGFRLVGESEWPRVHRAHVTRITWAVGPMWVLEGALSLWWAVRGPDRAVAMGHLVAEALAVAVTVAGAVPRHARLESRRDEHGISVLQRWHAVRTLCWVGAVILVLTSW